MCATHHRLVVVVGDRALVYGLGEACHVLIVDIVKTERVRAFPCGLIVERRALMVRKDSRTPCREATDFEGVWSRS